MSRLRMAVVGVGALGRHHARILSELPNVELVAVAERHAERGQEIAEKCRTRWVSDYGHIIDQIDAACVVVPTAAHFQVAGEFLRRGVPILLEKPLAANLHQAEQLAALARQQGLVLQVGHVERFNPAMRAAYPHVGAPKYIRAERTSTYTFRSIDIGVVHDLMIHDIDLVHWLAGDAKLVRAEAFGTCVMGGHEDIAQARLTFDNGCIADIHSSRISPTASRKLDVWADNGWFNIDLHQRTVSRVAPAEALRTEMSPWDQARQPGANIERLKSQVFGTFLEHDPIAVPAGDALTAELQHFVDCVQHGRQPLVSGWNGLCAMQTADQVLRSMAGHQWDGRAGGPVGPHWETPETIPMRRAA